MNIFAEKKILQVCSAAAAADTLTCVGDWGTVLVGCRGAETPRYCGGQTRGERPSKRAEGE